MSQNTDRMHKNNGDYDNADYDRNMMIFEEEEAFQDDDCHDNHSMTHHDIQEVHGERQRIVRSSLFNTLLQWSMKHRFLDLTTKELFLAKNIYYLLQKTASWIEKGPSLTRIYQQQVNKHNDEKGEEASRTNHPAFSLSALEKIIMQDLSLAYTRSLCIVEHDNDELVFFYPGFLDILCMNQPDSTACPLLENLDLLSITRKSLDCLTSQLIESVVVWYLNAHIGYLENANCPSECIVYKCLDPFSSILRSSCMQEDEDDESGQDFRSEQSSFSTCLRIDYKSVQMVNQMMEHVKVSFSQTVCPSSKDKHDNRDDKKRRTNTRVISKNVFSVWRNSVMRRQYNMIMFTPRSFLEECLPSFHKNHQDKNIHLVNLFRGFPFSLEECKKCYETDHQARKDMHFIRDHLLYVICACCKKTRTWIETYLSSKICRPLVKLLSTIICVGEEGNGKSTFFNEVIGFMFGNMYHEIHDLDDLLKRFNSSSVTGRLLLHLNDCMEPTIRPKQRNRFKQITTEKIIRLEEKFKSVTYTNNLVDMIITSNDQKLCGLMDGQNKSRRYLILATGNIPNYPMDTDSDSKKDEHDAPTKLIPDNHADRYFKQLRSAILRNGRAAVKAYQYYLSHVMNEHKQNERWDFYWKDFDNGRNPPINDAWMSVSEQNMDYMNIWWKNCLQRQHHCTLSSVQDKCVDWRMFWEPCGRIPYSHYCILKKYCLVSNGHEANNLSSCHSFSAAVCNKDEQNDSKLVLCTDASCSCRHELMDSTWIREVRKDDLYQCYLSEKSSLSSSSCSAAFKSDKTLERKMFWQRMRKMCPSMMLSFSNKTQREDYCRRRKKYSAIIASIENPSICLSLCSSNNNKRIASLYDCLSQGQKTIRDYFSKPSPSILRNSNSSSSFFSSPKKEEHDDDEDSCLSKSHEQSNLAGTCRNHNDDDDSQKMSLINHCFSICQKKSCGTSVTRKQRYLYVILPSIDQCIKEFENSTGVSVEGDSLFKPCSTTEDLHEQEEEEYNRMLEMMCGPFTSDHNRKVVEQFIECCMKEEDSPSKHSSVLKKDDDDHLVKSKHLRSKRGHSLMNLYRDSCCNNDNEQQE